MRITLHLSDFDHRALLELLRNDARRSEREGTADSPWAEAIRSIAGQVAAAIYLDSTDG